MDKITEKYKELVSEIREYESDTFSASAQEITATEAREVAKQFIIEDIQARIDTDTMDGVMIQEVLNDIRGFDSEE